MKNYRIFLSFFFITFIFYFSAQDGKFVNDTLFYISKIEEQGIKGVFTSYDMIFHWQFPALLYFLVYNILGDGWLAWHILFSLLHSLNALLFIHLLNTILPDKYRIASILGAFLFLISPYQAEVVAWGATLNYLVITALLIGGLLSVWNYFVKKDFKYLIYFHSSFVLSLFSLELAYVFPIIYFLFYRLFVYPNNTGADKEYFKKFLYGNIVAVVFYLIATRLFYGKWVAHFGSDTHLKFDISYLFSNFSNYIEKFFFNIRYLPDDLQSVFGHPISALIFISLIIYGLIYFSKRNKIEKNNSSTILFLLISSGVLLLPVLNLDNSFMFEMQSDRYGYTASLFLYTFICIYAYTLFDKWALAGAVIFYTVLFIPQTLGNSKTWGVSGDLVHKIIQNYPLNSGQKAIILNLPDNYQGAYCLRNGFVSGLSHLRGEDFSSDIIIASMMNIHTKDDEVSVTETEPNTFYVKLKKFGRWYYHQYISPEKSDGFSYSLNYDEWNTAYTLKINSTNETLHILKNEGPNWVIIATIEPY